MLRTGDLGSVSNDGYLSITGRIKEILITAGGENISPQKIENSLKDSRFIEQVAVFGDGMKYLSALVVPAFDELRQWADSRGILYKNRSDLIQKEQVIQLCKSEIEKNTDHLSRIEKVRKFTLLSEEWSPLTGELTPTLKNKRRVLAEKYEKEIRHLYS